jgi:hypothetical protein
MPRDIAGRLWLLPEHELCPVCHQPDNSGDCDHTLLDDESARELGALDPAGPPREGWFQ